MDVRLSTEQLELRDAAARMVADLAPRTVGDLDDPTRRSALERALHGAGWRELRTPTDDGTPWASGVEVAIVAEQLARGAADVAFVGPTLAAELRRLAGAEVSETPETLLLSSDLSTLSDEPASGIALDAAGLARALTVVRHGDRRTLVSVPLSPPASTIDLTRPTARPAGVATTVEHRHQIDDDVLLRLTVLATALATADLVGTMEGTTRLAIDHVGNRHQYGRPVGSFQAVHHLLADAFTFTEGSRSAALHAAWAVDSLPLADAVVATATAKAYAARAARAVCETSIQVHGGIGNTWECMAHVFLRRSLVATDLFGGISTNLDRVLAGHGIGGR